MWVYLEVVLLDVGARCGGPRGAHEHLQCRGDGPGHHDAGHRPLLLGGRRGGRLDQSGMYMHEETELGKKSNPIRR